MKEGMILKNELAGAQVPPDVGVSHATSGHGEQTERQDDHKEPPGRKQINQFVKSWWHLAGCGFALSCSLFAHADSP